jgi:hypothetical protein
MDLGLEDRRKKEETAAAWGQRGARRLRGRGWRRDREARGGGRGQGGARTGGPRACSYGDWGGVLGVYLYITPGCILVPPYIYI